MSLEIGNVVRYIAKEDSGMHRGELGEVISVCQNGRIRVRVKNRPPQYVSADQVEFVSATDHGIFDGGEKPESAEPAPDPQPKIDITPDPVLATAIESATRAANIVDMWPHFDDGVPVMLGDLVSHDDMVGEVTLFNFDADGYEIMTTEFDIELPFGETVKRGQDSMDLIWAATRDAINAGVLSRELFEQLCKRAQKLGDAQ